MQRVPLYRGARGILSTPALDRALLAVACLFAASAPLWTATLPGVPTTATAGPVVGAVLATVLGIHVVRRRPARPRPALPAVAFVTASVALVAWIWVNAAIWGQFVGGTARGALDVLAIALLAAATGALCPRDLRRPLVLATCLASVAAAAMALTDTGTGDLVPGLPRIAGRLEGPYGNPNGLGFVVALGIPVVLAFGYRRQRRLQALALATTAALAFTLLATFSRGALLGAGAGSLVVIAVDRASRRRRSPRSVAMGLAAVAVAALVVVVATPAFQDVRQRVNFADRAFGLDRSGWDTTGGRGFLKAGPSRLSNPVAGVVRVETHDPLAGAAFAWGTALPDFTYSLMFRAWAPSGDVQLRYALQDDLRGNGGHSASAAVTSTPRDLVVAWRPAAVSPNARLYVWQTAGPSVFELSDVRLELRRQPDDAPAQVISVPMVLKGLAEPAAFEHRFVQARKAALRLALEASTEHPLRGIGWGRFVDLAAQQLDYGATATHNEYLRVTVELGLPGLLLLLAAGAALALAIRRVDDPTVRAAAAGVTVAAAVALGFADALATASMVLPFAMTAGLVVGGWSARGDLEPAPQARDQRAGRPGRHTEGVPGAPGDQ